MADSIKTIAAAAAAEARKLKSATLQQYAVDEQKKEKDWRVRLHLAPGADYLYKSDNPGILAPLKATDGLIFPYTPEIAVQYNANYQNYELTHSNYKGYFYQGSKVENLIITATFTAQDRAEANYMLAAMHFLRSATKMFYGQDDSKRGVPPPILFLTGLGEFQFKNHPCALTMVNYNLETDVDYIAAGSMQTPPPRKTSTSARVNKSLAKGARIITGRSEPEANDPIEVHDDVTYVPTKIIINFTAIPIQTRDQVSNEFSLEKYASGELLKKGFW